MKYKEYVIKRLILLIPVMFGVSLLSFVLSNAVGDPIASYVGQSDDKISPERMEVLRVQLGLDQPWYVQYSRYLGRLFQGDLGESASYNPPLPVLEVIVIRFPATAELSVFSLIIAILVGIPLGIISAIKKDKVPDHMSRIAALSGVSMPIFWLGLMLQVLLFNVNGILENSDIGFQFPYHERWTRNDYPQPTSILFGMVPASGFMLLDSILFLPTDTPLFDSVSTSFLMFIDVLLHLFPPAFCLSWLQMALFTRMTRMSMLETMRQDYILLAKSKGLTERIIIYRHALRNAIIPTLTVAGLSLAGLLTGTVLTETVFSWPGLGRWAVNAVANLDLAAIQGFVLVAAVLYVLSNLGVDLLYGFIDPRIRYD